MLAPWDPWSASESSFFQWAVTESANREVEDWQSKVFHFARLMRRRFKEKTKVGDVLKIATPYIQQHGGWWECFEMDEEDGRAEFRACWKRIRFLPEMDPLVQALQRAEAFPVGAPRNENREGSPTPKYDRFVSVVGYLQLIVGDGHIFLPCKRLSELLKTTPRMVKLWRDEAIDDGIIVVVAEHEWRSAGKGSKATEFKVSEGFTKFFASYLKKKLHGEGK